MLQKAVLSIVLLLLMILTFGTQLDDKARQVHEESFERAIGAFAIAKGLNAVISLIQGTELNASPAGIGVTISVGQVLDPMNDIIERFSWVMLVASVSLGIVKLLLTMGDLLYLQLTLLIIITLYLTTLWYKPFQASMTSMILLRLGIILLLLRFSALLFVNTQEVIYSVLMQPQYESATQTLMLTQKELEDIATQNDTTMIEERDWLESLQDSYDDAKTFINIKEQLHSLQTLFDDAQKEIVTLIAIFVVLTILLPLLFIWMTFAMIRWAFTGQVQLQRE